MLYSEPCSWCGHPLCYAMTPLYEDQIGDIPDEFPELFDVPLEQLPLPYHRFVQIGYRNHWLSFPAAEPITHCPNQRCHMHLPEIRVQEEIPTDKMRAVRKEGALV